MPDFSLEDALSDPVCGIDEAGRGPLAGPVVAACVYAPPENRGAAFWSRVNDSKALTRSARETLFDTISESCVVGIAGTDVADIDSLNILQATFLAMRRAFATVQDKMDKLPAHALVDGNGAPPGLPCNVLPVIKGDTRSLSIAAASILAKVTRDRIMDDLSQAHPNYGWASNAGYPTADHIKAINAHGITEHHRRSFGPVKAYLICGECRTKRAP